MGRKTTDKVSSRQKGWGNFFWHGKKKKKGVSLNFRWDLWNEGRELCGM